MTENIKHYSELEPFDANTNYLKLMIDTSTGLLESSNPSELYFHITTLRRMRKFHKTFFENIFNNIVNQFNKIFLSDSTSVTINALTLTTELFSTLDHESLLTGWFIHLLPAIFEHSINHDQDIRNQAIICLNTCSNNMWYTEAIESLLEILIDNSNNEVTQNILFTLIGIVKSIDEENLIYHFNWEYVMNVVEGGWIADELIRDNMREFLRVIHSRLQDKFDAFLNTMRPEQANLCLEIIN
jgi:hypothetical protein